MELRNTDDLEALRDNVEESKFSEKELAELRKEARRIVLREEERQKEMRRAEMEEFFESYLYA